MSSNYFRDMKLTTVKLTCCDRNCPDRSAECHGSCEKYQAFRAKCDEASEERYQKKNFEREMDKLAWKAVNRLHGKRSY